MQAEPRKKRRCQAAGASLAKMQAAGDHAAAWRAGRPGLHLGGCEGGREVVGRTRDTHLGQQGGEVARVPACGSVDGVSQPPRGPRRVPGRKGLRGTGQGPQRRRYAARKGAGHRLGGRRAQGGGAGDQHVHPLWALPPAWKPGWPPEVAKREDAAWRVTGGEMVLWRSRNVPHHPPARRARACCVSVPSTPCRTQSSLRASSEQNPLQNGRRLEKRKTYKLS